MRIPRNILANQVLHHSFWWSYCVRNGKEELVVSEPFQQLLQTKPNSLEQFFSAMELPLVRVKLNEVLQHTNSNVDVRFMSTYQFGSETRTFQNALQVIQHDGVDLVWAQAIDVSEMARFEKEMVDAQGRLNIQNVQQRQAILEDQNRLIRESYDKQSRFLGLLSHELRSPLLGIGSLIKRLKEQHELSDDVALMLSTINATAEQANYLVNDILTYSQTQFGKVTLHPAKISLTELLENVKRLTKSIASDKNLMVSMIPLNHHDWVYADGVRLTQVLTNLIINAIKFTQYGGVNIEVTEPQAGHVCFKVTDSGEGISNEVLQTIFEPFAQIDSVSGDNRARALGAGLGLFVVKELVSLMGGEIKVYSQLGVGTTFEFTLELELAEAPKIESQSKTKTTSPISSLPETGESKKTVPPIAEKPTGQSRNKILVADDSGINRMVLAGYLHDLDCDVYEAADGRQAWQMFQQGGFDYVLLDIQMPYMDGMQVGEKIKHADQGLKQNLKGVFAITAGGDSSGFIEVSKKPTDYGFDKWLIKPVSKEQVIKLIGSNFRSNEIAQSSDLNAKDSIETGGLEASNDLLYNATDIPNQFVSLLPRFIEETRENLLLLQRYNKQKDRENIKQLAHYLKGNCMLFQLSNWSNELKNLEILQQESENQRFQNSAIIVKDLLNALKYLENSL